MAETLYLRLDYPLPGETRWRTSDGIVGQGQLVDAAEFAPGRRIVVIVESKAVILLEAILPTRKRDRLLQAVPYALEEQLAAEIESLHFALGNPVPTIDDKSLYQISVAVVARTQMDKWLGALTEVGINPHALIPAVLALPYEPETWTLLLEQPDLAILRTGPQSGLAVEPAWLSLVIEQAATPPLKLRIFAQNDTVSTTLPPLSVAVEEQPDSKDSLALFVDGYRPEQSLDLLQGAYSRHEHFDRLWRPWRTAAILFISLIGLQLGEMFFEERHLSAADLALRTRMADIYQATFPDARKIINPYVQMEQKVTALRTQPEEATTGLIGLLARAAPVLQKTVGCELRTLRYKTPSLELDLSLKNLPLLDQLKKNLTEAGLDVEIRTARAQGDSVDGNLILRDK